MINFPSAATDPVRGNDVPTLITSEPFLDEQPLSDNAAIIKAAKTIKTPFRTFIAYSFKKKAH
jgi:hypothetical protein